MSIPTEQVDPFTRKVGGKRKRRPKRKARGRQIGTKSPNTEPSGGPQPKKIFGHYKPPPPPPQRRALDWRGLRERGVFYHPNYARKLWNRGDFPKPFKPSPRRLAWWSDEIDAWLKLKAGATDQKIAPDDEQPAGDTEVTLKLSPDELAAVRRLLGRELVGTDSKPEPRISKRKPQPRRRR